MPDKTSTQTNIYWHAIFIVEFSNTNILHHEKREVHAGEVEIKEQGTENDIIPKLLGSFDKARVQKSIEPGKNFCLIKKIKLQAFVDSSYTNGVQAPVIHLQLNRATETFFNLPKYSLLR